MAAQGQDLWVSRYIEYESLYTNFRTNLVRIDVIAGLYKSLPRPFIVERLCSLSITLASSAGELRGFCFNMGMFGYFSYIDNFHKRYSDAIDKVLDGSDDGEQLSNFDINVKPYSFRV